MMLNLYDWCVKNNASIYQASMKFNITIKEAQELFERGKNGN